MAIDEIYKMPLSGTWDLQTAAQLQQVLTYIHENAVGIQYSSDAPDKVGPGKLIVDNDGGITYKAADGSLQTSGGSASTPDPFAGINSVAWVYMDDAGTILSSYHISSITKTSTGSYTVNFSFSFSDTNYLVLATCDRIATEYRVATVTTSSKSVTGFSFSVTDLNANLADPDFISLMIFNA